MKIIASAENKTNLLQCMS